MGETGLTALAAGLRRVDAEWVVLDRLGTVVDGVAPVPVGERVETWIPGWTPEAEPIVQPTRDERHVRLELMATAGDHRLYLVLDRTDDVVSGEARFGQERRRAQADLAGSTAREMNDSMTIVQGRLELLRSFALADPKSAERHCSIALEHAQRAVQALHDLRLVGSLRTLEVWAFGVVALTEGAIAACGLEERVHIDVHPPELAVLGRQGPLQRVFHAVLAAQGMPRESLTVRARRHGDVVQVEVTGPNRRRPDMDGLQLGIVSALVEALAGRMEFTAAGVQFHLPAERQIPAELPEPGGVVLVVGARHLADRVGEVLGGDPWDVHSEPTAEAALPHLGDSRYVGLVTELLLPERSGLTLYRQAMEVRPDLALGPLLVTPDPVRTLPGGVRLLCGPLTRARLLHALTG